jgi:hypothetical protein
METPKYREKATNLSHNFGSSSQNNRFLTPNPQAHSGLTHGRVRPHSLLNQQKMPNKTKFKVESLSMLRKRNPNSLLLKDNPSETQPRRSLLLGPSIQKCEPSRSKPSLHEDFFVEEGYTPLLDPSKPSIFCD